MILEEREEGENKHKKIKNKDLRLKMNESKIKK